MKINENQWFWWNPWISKDSVGPITASGSPRTTGQLLSLGNVCFRSVSERLNYIFCFFSLSGGPSVLSRSVDTVTSRKIKETNDFDEIHGFSMIDFPGRWWWWGWTLKFYAKFSKISKYQFWGKSPKYFWTVLTSPTSMARFWALSGCLDSWAKRSHRDQRYQRIAP